MSILIAFLWLVVGRRGLLKAIKIGSAYSWQPPITPILPSCPLCALSTRQGIAPRTNSKQLDGLLSEGFETTNKPSVAARVLPLPSFSPPEEVPRLKAILGKKTLIE